MSVVVARSRVPKQVHVSSVTRLRCAIEMNYKAAPAEQGMRMLAFEGALDEFDECPCAATTPDT